MMRTKQSIKKSFIKLWRQIIFEIIGLFVGSTNRPFPRYFLPQFQNESSCKNLSNEDKFDLHENESVVKTHLHMDGFTRRIVLTQRHRDKGATRE